jgi:hypothetical protein
MEGNNNMKYFLTNLGPINVSLFLHLQSVTNLHECEDQAWFNVQAVSGFSSDLW